jgi:hypothetical protein
MIAPVLAAAAALLAPPPAWAPDVAAARAYGHTRPGVIAFAVRTDDRLWGWRVDKQFPSASVLKAMLLVAYLRHVRDRPLRHSERALLTPMIRRSDNFAATTIRNRIGDAALVRLAHRTGMTRFVPGGAIWGNSQITARDQTRFFLHIDRFVPPRHPRLRDAAAANGHPLAALGDRSREPPGLDQVLQGRLGLGHRPRGQPGGAAGARGGARVRGGSHGGRRVARSRQGDAAGDLRAVVAGAAGRRRGQRTACWVGK